MPAILEPSLNVQPELGPTGKFDQMPETTEQPLVGESQITEAWEEYTDEVLWPETQATIVTFKVQWAMVVIWLRSGELDSAVCQEAAKKIYELTSNYEQLLTEIRLEAERHFAFLVEDMAKNLRHEMRNLLTSVYGYMQLVISQPNESVARSYFLDRSPDDILEKYHVTQEAWRNQLSQDIIHEDQLTARHLEEVTRTEKRSDPINETIRYDFQDEVASDSPVQLKFGRGNDQTLDFSALVLPREKYITAYIRELIRNALYFLRDRPNPEICVSITRDQAGGGYTISVEDNGPGIAKEAIPAILKGGISTRGGTGSGVSVGRRLLKVLTGSEVTIEERESGLGAKFLIHVPEPKIFLSQLPSAQQTVSVSR
jgi:signal transduction histidine kinase